jgi:hypothetical protein
LPATVKGGNSVIWINDNFIPYTPTSGNPDNEEAPAGTLFDTGKGYSIYQRSQFICKSCLTNAWQTGKEYYQQ